MNSELESQVWYADKKLESYKKKLDDSSRDVNCKVKVFGDYREQTLNHTVIRFRNDLSFIGKKLKGNEYLIPSGFESIKRYEHSFELVSFTPEQSRRISANVGKIITFGGNKLIDVIAKRKGIDVSNSRNRSSSNSGSWLDLAAALLGLASDYYMKKEAEKTAVEKYVAETDVLCERIQVQIDFMSRIQDRIKELIDVTEQLKSRSLIALENFERFLNIFDVENTVHLKSYQTALILVKGISEISKVEILDSQNQISKSDENYIISSRKLLTSSL